MKTLNRAISALVVCFAMIATMLGAASPALAALQDVSSIKETADTGVRPAATRLPVALSPEIQASVDVGTGNLNTTMSIEGFTFAHNSLVPAPSGNGVRNSWRVSGLGAGMLYREAGNVVLVDASGQRVTFNPVAGSTTDFTAPPERRYTLKKTDAGYTVLAWDSQSTTYFNSDGKPVKATDRDGNTTTLTTDAAGIPTQQTGWRGPAAARTSWRTPTSSGDTVGVGAQSSSLVRSWTLSATNGKYSAVTNPRGTQTKISYDSAGRISRVDTADGGYTKITYDLKNRVASITTPGAPGSAATEAVTRFSYPDAGKTLVAAANTDQSKTVAAVPHTTYTLTAAGRRVQSVVDADGKQTSKTYTPQLSTESMTAGAGDTSATSSFKYDANDGGSLTSGTGPGGETGSAEYKNTAANTKYAPSTSTDSRGNQRGYTYSGSGALAKTTDALAATAELTFNADGTVATATAPGNAGNPTRYTYDANKQLSRVTPATGGSIKAESYTYDSMGRLSKKTTGRGGVVTYTYDGSSSLVTRVTATPAGTTTPDTQVDTTYDTMGRPVTVTSSAKGKQTQKVTYAYSNRGEVTQKTVSQAGIGSEAAQSTTMTFGYDREGRMTSKTVGGFKHSYAYTAAGTLDKITYPEGTEQRVINFKSDDKGRRTDIWYGSERAAPEQGWTVWKHTDYDVSGNIARQTVKRSGAVTPSATNPDGVQTLDDKWYCYKPGVEPRDCGASTVPSVDKVQSMYTTLAGTTTGYTTKYSYDKVGRLTGVDTPGTADGKYVFTYDSRGNRVKKERTVDGQAPVTETDTYNAQNQVTSDGWVYDADGNVTKDEKATTVFNAANQKVETKLADGTNNTTSTFAGTSQNELIGQVSSKQGSFVYTHGLTDRYGNPQIEKITHEGRQAYVEHDPVTHEPLFLRDTNKTSVHMYIGDPVDSDIRMVQGDGSTADYKEFDPFGARPEKISPRDKEKFDPYRYRFGLVDRGGTGQYLFGARFYDPNQGVWTQQDSLDAPLDPVNANRYAYAGADPINNIDPSGTDAWETKLEVCAGLCVAFGPTYDTGTEELSLDASFGVGKLSGAVTSGWTESSPADKFGFSDSVSCSAAYGFGAYTSSTMGLGGNPGERSVGGVAGLGGGCSYNIDMSIPIK